MRDRRWDKGWFQIADYALWRLIVTETLRWRRLADYGVSGSGIPLLAGDGSVG
jgi:hypothetical protein